ncbi:hypothetical protein [Moorena sp. SIO3I6]|uniref:hypothetical protein n=1 Tax=Moorena sp. SIO3I6 TaxID=2607831 RepID=UPI0013F7D0BA|nr:hypothetical protein [Moorena sp. SIO3I6]NEP24854.1 hypothetical protein [Moorena sp. SIO3I6]
MKIVTDSAGKPLPVHNLLSYPTAHASGNGLTFRLTFFCVTFYRVTFYQLTYPMGTPKANNRLTYPTPNAKGEQQANLQRNLGQKATLREQPSNLGQKATLREQPSNLLLAKLLLANLLL